VQNRTPLRSGNHVLWRRSTERLTRSTRTAPMTCRWAPGATDPTLHRVRHD
jgi:hypothetical protein